MQGSINIFNCLNGAHLKTVPVTNMAIRHMLYSPDKTIIAIAGQVSFHDIAEAVIVIILFAEDYVFYTLLVHFSYF